jgi:hypothetical protein
MLHLQLISSTNVSAIVTQKEHLELETELQCQHGQQVGL